MSEDFEHAIAALTISLTSSRDTLAHCRQELEGTEERRRKLIEQIAFYEEYVGDLEAAAERLRNVTLDVLA